MIDLDRALEEEEEQYAFLHVRMPAELHSSVKKEAEKRDVSLSRLVRAVLTEAVKRGEE